MGLMKFLLGSIGVQWLFLFSLVKDYSFLLVGQKLRITFLTLPVYFVNVNSFLCLSLFI